MPNLCKCGCGESVKKGRVFVNKEHQLDWMVKGGAREIGALEPEEARIRGGEVSGQKAAASGRLMESARLGGARAREIAEEFRRRRAME